MKSKNCNNIITTLIFIIILISINNYSYAGVEIKYGTTPYTNIDISESFDICYNLRDGTSTLGMNNLDPHLATSLDWGAVAYLAQSRYGANASTVSINTTGNESGIMNMSGYYTQTATIFESRNVTSNDAINYRYRLEEAIKSPDLSKYVDVISNNVDVNTTKGRAMAETMNWYGAIYGFSNASNTDKPLIIRDSYNLFGTTSYLYHVNGQAYENLTFRPVIWN